EPRGIDHAKFEAREIGLALAAVARDAGAVVDERDALPDEAVEERGFADIGPAHKGDDGKHQMPVQENGERNYWRVSAHGSSGALFRAARGVRVFCAALALGCSASG